MAEYIEREQAKFQIYREFITEKDTSVRAFRALDVIPSADVKPVLHGYWIVRRGNWQDEYECSVCRYISKDGSDYCSNCGARMDDYEHIN